jgi:hypothetical protein
MASRLAERHIVLNAELRARTVKQLERVWRSLPNHRDETLPAWLSVAVPLAQAAQRAEIAITQAYLARAIDRPVAGVDADRLIAESRNGADPNEVYSRPFNTVWTALGNGTPYDAAAEQGLARATQTIATDIQLAMRDTLTAVGESEEIVWGYQRVTDGAACDFCLLLNGAQFRTEDPMPIHPNCGCGVEPIVYTRGFSNRNNLERFNATATPEGVAISPHGELGPVVGDPAHNFSLV